MTDNKKEANDLIPKLGDDDLIYHYTQASTAIEHILYSGKLKFSSIRTMRDPYEIQREGVTLSFSDTEPEVEKWYKTEDVINKIKDKIKVACFCLSETVYYSLDEVIKNNYINDKIDYYIFKNQTVNVNPQNIYVQSIEKLGYRKIDMWDKYADCFKGVCLGFSKSALIEQIKGDSEINQDLSKYEKIKYYPESYFDNIKLRDIDNLDLINKSPEEVAMIFIKKYYDELFLIKNIDYSNENEYRIIFYTENEDKKYLDITNCLRVVIVGEKFPDCYLEVIKKEIIEFKRVYSYRLFHRFGTYDLEIL